MAKKVKLGDVFQVLTSQGVAYAQVTHKHPEFGFLIRVFPGFYDKRPENLSGVVNVEPQFSAFFVVQSAVNQGFFFIVDNVPISEDLQVFPMFRARNGGPGGAIWLWNGNESFRLEREINSEELKYPTMGIISAPLLIERIEKNYTAETHEIW